MTYQGSSFEEEDVASHIEVLVGRYGSVAEAWEMVNRPGYAPETPLWNAIRTSLFYQAMDFSMLEPEPKEFNHPVYRYLPAAVDLASPGADKTVFTVISPIEGLIRTILVDRQIEEYTRRSIKEGDPWSKD